jgi:hypothetical protein
MAILARLQKWGCFSLRLFPLFPSGCEWPVPLLKLQICRNAAGAIG